MSDGYTLQIERGQTVPYLDQWLGQWFIEPERGRALFGVVRQLNLAVHLREQPAARMEDPAAPPFDPPAVDYERSPRARVAYGYRVVEGVAVLELCGSLMKHEASATESTSTVMMRRTARKLAHDDQVKAVIFQIDSPGGTVAGAYELASDIAALAKAKPVHAHASNLVASAAYLMASQMRSISATPSTLVGSLGTFGVVYDFSAAAEKDGIKVHLLKGRVRGKEALMKGAGTPGTEITPEQLERMQEGVDDLNEQFIQAVLDGPRKPKQKDVEAWFTDAGVWIAARSKSMGLIDRVESLDDMLARVISDTGGRRPAPRRSGAAIEGQPTESHDAGGTSAGGNTTTAEASAEAGGSEAVSNPGTDREKGADMSQQGQTAGTTTAAAEQPKPATMAELKAACPGASSDFLVAQAEASATVAQAKDAFLHFQAAQIRSRDEELAKLKNSAAATASAPATAEKKEEPAPKKPGVAAVESRAAEQQKGGTGAGDGSAVAEFEQRVKALTDAGVPRAKAAQRVLSADDTFRQQYVAELNARAK